MSKTIGKPTRGKLTCKGNVPEKLKEAGIDHTGLTHLTLPMNVDHSKAATAIADAVVSAIKAEKNAKGVSFAELLEKDSNNGVGYLTALHGQIVKEVQEVANGTAVQGRAFKAAFAKNNGLDVSIFESDGKGTKSVAAPSDFD